MVKINEKMQEKETGFIPIMAYFDEPSPVTNIPTIATVLGAEKD